ncbi:hypothetical protein [Fibrella forsythiae]|uniref:Carboxypeptidase-like regulatory domain-containing protein n=1 Tax=Fibrella forsythiae TaxID=2817061 RepID=A0ABS3JNV9_9BACT|nr:hypothetical protein [Fibrella forsythiae]MBO0951683.1 hypothetical protein [Fibrella forsythiae]
MNASMTCRFCGLLLAFLLLQATVGAQPGQSVQARVVHTATGRPLSGVTLSVADGALGSATNADGYFQIRLPASLQHDTLLVTAVNFRSVRLPLAGWPAAVVAIQLDSVASRPQRLETDAYFSLSRPFSARDTILKAVARIARNYSDVPTLLRGFYRETIKPEQSETYALYAEGLVDVYKPSYYFVKQDDQIRFVKGRRKPLTRLTIPVLSPGPWVSTMLDVVKYQEFLFRNGRVNTDYVFNQTGEATLDGQPVHIISFAPRSTSILTAYFTGRLFVTAGKLAIVRAEYSLTPKGLSVLNKSGYAQVYKTEMLQRTYVATYTSWQNRWSLQSGSISTAVRQVASGTRYEGQIDFAVTHREPATIKPFSAAEQADFRKLPMQLFNETDTTFWAGETILTPLQVR